MNNENFEFYDNSINRFYTEKEIRQIDFEENINDLRHNKKDIFEGIINVQSVCQCIVNSLNADIKEVVNDLNKCWGYNIEILENNDTKKCLKFIFEQYEKTEDKEGTSNALDMIREIIVKLQKYYNI